MRPPVPRRSHGHHSPSSIEMAWCVMAAALWLNACGDPLVARELVANNRVLGARVELEGDATEAWVAPAQTASVRWLVVSPNGPPTLGWAFSLCVAAPVSRDLPICAAKSFAHFASTEPTATEPHLDFVMPDAAALEGISQITANGAFCSSGNPITLGGEVTLPNVRCPDATEQPLLATMGIFVASNEATNQNPSFPSVEVDFDGTPWPTWTEPSSAWSSCAGRDESLPTIQADSQPHALTFALPTALAEPLLALSVHSATRETIQLSHFVTAGDLERAFSTVDFAQPAPQVEVAWTAPRVVPSEGRLVRFYFVLRDGRGGTDWSARAVCVVP